MSTINITERFRQARLNDRAGYVEKEKAKAGNLRAGSSGLASDDGEIAGQCHRKSLLRSKGIEIDPPTEDKLIMFELGYANEDRIFEILQSSIEPGEVILREEEIPIEWRTTNGTKVTGRPDMVICSGKDVTPDPGLDDKIYEDVIPKLLLELKSVHSLWTAREVLFNRKPKLDNMVQAAHYMWKLGVPGKLLYRAYSQLGQGMAGNEWITKQFPKPGEPMSEFVEYTVQKRDPSKYSIKHIKQFDLVYDLRFTKSGRLEFKLEAENSKQWTSTIISHQDIERYYEYVSQMEENKVLGDRPLTVAYDGEKLNYTSCQYCPLAPVCDSHEGKGFEKWMAEVKKTINMGDKK